MLTFTEQEMATIIQGLGMLPANQSYALLKKIEESAQQKTDAGPDLETN